MIRKHWVSLSEDNTNKSEKKIIYFRVCVIGQLGVGTSSLSCRLCRNIYPLPPTTSGAAFEQYKVEKIDSKVILQIWDAPLYLPYRPQIAMLLRDTQGLACVYDVTNRKSFELIQSILNEYSKIANPVIVLIGNKCDLENDRQVQFDEGLELAQSHGIQFFETSAERNLNVKLAFDTLTNQIEQVN